MRRTLLFMVFTLVLVFGWATAAHAQYASPSTLPGDVGAGEEPAVQPAQVSSGDLARTGSNADEWIRVAIVLTTVGALLVLASRKRSAVVREAA